MANFTDFKKILTDNDDRGPVSLLALASVVALVVAIAMPHDHSLRPLRIVLAILGLSLTPGWLLVRHLGTRTVLWVRLFAAVMVSSALYVIFDAIADKFISHLSKWDYVVPAVIIGAALVGLTREKRERVAGVGVLVSTVLIVAACVGATAATHDLLAPVPLESSYSVSAPVANVTDGILHVPISIQRVSDRTPLTVTLGINYARINTYRIKRSVSSTVLTYALPSSEACGQITVQVYLAQSRILSPILRCP